MKNKLATAPDYIKDFKKEFESFSYSRNWYTTFHDFVEIAACTVHQIPYHAGEVEKDDDYDEFEKRYLEIIKKYNSDETQRISNLFNIIVAALTSQTTDILGHIYMDMGIANKHNGEFFTPSHVCYLMASLTLTNIEEVISKKGYFLVQEPTCGAGVMLIESANVVRERGYDPRQVMLFEATDINPLCANMTFIQLSLMGMAGVVRCGDSLKSNETFQHLITPQLRLYRKQTGKTILPLPEPTPAINQNLPLESMPQPDVKMTRKGQYCFGF